MQPIAEKARDDQHPQMLLFPVVSWMERLQRRTLCPRAKDKMSNKQINVDWEGNYKEI
jgi:hypothetical protein